MALCAIERVTSDFVVDRQKRLRQIICHQHDGELLVVSGNARRAKRWLCFQMMPFLSHPRIITSGNISYIRSVVLNLF